MAPGVRADFDDAGLNHVAAILAAAPGARPWRFGTADYRQALAAASSTVALRVERLPATPWDPDLSEAMGGAGVAVFEESFVDDLVDDIRRRQFGLTCSAIVGGPVGKTGRR